MAKMFAILQSQYYWILIHLNQLLLAEWCFQNSVIEILRWERIVARVEDSDPEERISLKLDWTDELGLIAIIGISSLLAPVCYVILVEFKMNWILVETFGKQHEMSRNDRMVEEIVAWKTVTGSGSCPIEWPFVLQGSIWRRLSEMLKLEVRSIKEVIVRMGLVERVRRGRVKICWSDGIGGGWKEKKSKEGWVRVMLVASVKRRRVQGLLG